MNGFGYVVLVLFIVIRVLIAAGLLYLVIVELRKYKGHRVDNKEVKKNTDGKRTGNSPNSRN